MIAAALVAGATLGAVWAALPYASGYRCFRGHDWTDWRPESTTYFTSANQDYAGVEVEASRVCLRCGAVPFAVQLHRTRPLVSVQLLDRANPNGGD